MLLRACAVKGDPQDGSPTHLALHLDQVGNADCSILACRAVTVACPSPGLIRGLTTGAVLARKTVRDLKTARPSAISQVS